MWYFQRMLFYVETLHQFDNFFGRVYIRVKNPVNEQVSGQWLELYI